MTTIYLYYTKVLGHSNDLKCFKFLNMSFGQNVSRDDIFDLKIMAHYRVLWKDHDIVASHDKNKLDASEKKGSMGGKQDVKSPPYFPDICCY